MHAVVQARHGSFIADHSQPGQLLACCTSSVHFLLAVVSGMDCRSAAARRYVSKEELLTQSDFLSLHCPLLPSTFHIIDGGRFDLHPEECVEAPETAEAPQCVLH